MSTRINLLLHSDHHSHYNQRLLARMMSSVESCFILIVVVVAGLVLPYKSETEPLLKRWADSPFFAQIRAESLTHNGQHAALDELRENFLINEKIKDPLLREEFEQSGLAHLLAISGGQTAPAAAAISFFMLMIIVACTRTLKNESSLKWLAGLRLATGLLHTLVIFFLVGLYQSSGALTRALANHITLCARSLLLFTVNDRHNNCGKTRGLMLASPWCLGWILLQNPVRDLSFLLSALGALTSLFVSQLLALVIRADSTETLPLPGSSRLLGKYLFAPVSMKISMAIVSVSLTSALMSLLTIPFWPAGNILEKVLANILAGPCVMFIITPAALGICVSVVFELAGLGFACHAMLRCGLEILLYTARTFGNPVDQVNQQQSAEFFASMGVSPSVVIACEILLLSVLTEMLRTRLGETENLLLPRADKRVSAFVRAKTHALRFFDKIR
jgi:hypothetical protein